MPSALQALITTAQLRLQRSGNGPYPHDQLVKVIRAVRGFMEEEAEEVSEAVLLRELEARLNVYVGKETVLEDAQDHIAWLNAERKTDWAWWPRYRQYLEPSLPMNSLTALDESTDRVLSLLEDPRRSGSWDRRGLVVGHVQSGKTANYTGLICKAADAGYKIIIVLAGIHSNLRAQTQIRLDEGFLGYESAGAEHSKREYKPVGVGLLDQRASLRPDSVTTRLENGDFKKSVAKQFNVTAGGRPMLFVVKKNASVLKHLLEWVHWAAGRKKPEETHLLIRETPLLLIDDEADNASVDTKDGAFDEEGRPNEEHDPTAINRAIRKLLIAFEKRVYVGYTATPFANIFIHDQGRTGDSGPDLFPRSFIVNLPTPSNYAGPVRIFGLTTVPEEQRRPGLNLIRHVEDFEQPHEKGKSKAGWMPTGHKLDHLPRHNGKDQVPQSLQEAIRAFVLVCAARRARGHKAAYNSMLIHVTRFTNVQHHVKQQVEHALQQLRQRLLYGEGALGTPTVDELCRLWKRDFCPTTRQVRMEVKDPSLTDLTFEQLHEHVLLAIQDIKVREINGQAGDILDYSLHRETGLSVIAVGGDKLARGLTLEGLSVSYFLRPSRMYDTLMQMGRWFGYRPGYLDLCRLYCPPELEDWYCRITEAAEELRAEFDRMVISGGTPRDYGLKVVSHPSLLVTSATKMRHSEEVKIAYAGSLSETVSFHRTAPELKRNWEALERLVIRLGPHMLRSLPGRADKTNGSVSGRIVWENVSSDLLLSFLGDLVTHPEARRSNTWLIAQYIRGMLAQGELTNWTVALMQGNKGDKEQVRKLGPLTLNLVRRTARADYPDRFVIRRLLSPSDEAIDLSVQEWNLAMSQTEQAWKEKQRQDGPFSPEKADDKPSYPAGIYIRNLRSSTQGLLLIYPLSPRGEDGQMFVDEDIPVVGFALSFPGSKKAREVSYRVNPIYWAQELSDGTGE